MKLATKSEIGVITTTATVIRTLIVSMKINVPKMVTIPVKNWVNPSEVRLRTDQHPRSHGLRSLRMNERQIFQRKLFNLLKRLCPDIPDHIVGNFIVAGIHYPLCHCRQSDDDRHLSENHKDPGKVNGSLSHNRSTA